MRNMMLAAAMLIAFFAAVPGGAEPYYSWAEGMEGNGVFAVGWSTDGKRFAYGVYRASMQIARHVDLTVAVQDVVTDKIVWSFAKQWDESLMGPEDTTPYPPESASEAWQLAADKFDPPLRAMGFFPGGTPLLDLPFDSRGSGDIISVEIVPGEMGFQVRALSKKLGGKVIFEGRGNPAEDAIAILGYFPNPDGSRIAVVLEITRMGAVLSDYVVIGCNVRSGFKK